MTQIHAAGFVCCDRQHETIWGWGATEDIAWARMVEEMRMCGVKVVEALADDEWATGSETLDTNFVLLPSTQALMDQIEQEGGQIAWGVWGRIACTKAEEDGEG